MRYDRGSYFDILPLGMCCESDLCDVLFMRCLAISAKCASVTIHSSPGGTKPKFIKFMHLPYLCQVQILEQLSDFSLLALLLAASRNRQLTSMVMAAICRVCECGPTRHHTIIHLASTSNTRDYTHRVDFTYPPDPETPPDQDLNQETPPDLVPDPEPPVVIAMQVVWICVVGFVSAL